MKREIIFRSWNETDQCFYYFTQGLYFDSFDFNNEVDAFCFKWSNAEEFTGLTDKNGNKIFEEDVLKGKYLVYHQDPELLPIEHDISGEVKFIEGFFACENFSFVYPEYEVEIIGNIHESLTPNK
ncbi:YopX family protein [Elizabethkingia anophelis]|uniref:YopX protein domain-containing protein n=1 Tax=Elizabethkingia anophelis TaxID=1117645 RepID=A0AAU8USQ1_9FLAO|nr:YopX family protein [Elizabethkingia anophelis]AQX00462.1 hypothetical protein BBD32_02765 [Elizabethkingia anophelis]OPB66230.1 hypothetical protein BAY11_14795 [Elizabethkingia anophelis]